MQSWIYYDLFMSDTFWYLSNDTTSGSRQCILWPERTVNLFVADWWGCFSLKAFLLLLHV
jgi:hypothetical protein